MGASDWAAAAGVVVLWGLTVVAAKIGVSQIPPFLLMSMRFAIAGVLLGAYLRPVRFQPHGRLALLAFTLCVGHFGLMFIGLKAVDAGVTAILLQLGIPFSAGLAALMFGERLSLGQMGGMFVAFLGAVLLMGGPKTASEPLHVAIVVVSAFMWALTNVQVKRLGAVPPMTMNAWVSIMAAPMLLVMSLIFETGHMDALRAADGRAWGAFAFIVIGASLVAWGLWYRLLTRHPINKVAPLTFFAPLVTVIAATFLVDEPITLRLVAGGVLTIAGVAMVERLRAPGPRPNLEPPHD